MLKVLIGGIAVGLANIIPGVSGGTMMVILGLFNRVMQAISGVFSKHNEKRKQDIIFLLVLAIGAIIGLVVFANLLEFLFEKYPTQTMYCFVGMVAFSIPSLKRKEMKEDRFQCIPLLLGCALIFMIAYFAPQTADVIISEFPAIDIVYLIKMVLIGIIAGGAMFVPGVSGSMLLLILGEYYLFKSLAANVTSFDINVIVPLLFMGLGIVLGIILSSKATAFALKKNHSATMNFILGLVIASSIVLIPFGAHYDFFVIASSVGALLAGGVLVVLLEKIA